ncbi:hypothetical protein NPIL_91561 [Nephila pilipes]|uniref:Uncharacterized protein n=1 Tax=Nephila pilipes TaxID=299642 RepID=A0A8X6NVD6_NEPPI|nr:hypothetical protein NPIL_91561 [Nephila pilipes]
MRWEGVQEHELALDYELLSSYSKVLEVIHRMCPSGEKECYHFILQSISSKHLEQGHYMEAQKKSSPNYFFPHTMGYPDLLVWKEITCQSAKVSDCQTRFLAFSTTKQRIYVAKKNRADVG